MSKDAFLEAAKILSTKLEVALDEAQVLVFVGHWQKTEDYSVGPFPEKMVEGGWVNEVFVTSSNLSKAEIQSMFRQGHLYPRQVQNEDGAVSCDYRWMRVPDDVESAVRDSFAELG